MVLKKFIVSSILILLASNISFCEELIQNEKDYDLKILTPDSIETSEESKKNEFKILDDKLDINTNQNTNHLSFDDLVNLYRDKNYKQEITTKIFSQPVLDNTISQPSDDYPYKNCPNMGNYIRVSFWSIDGGINYEKIEDIFFSPEKLTKKLIPKTPK